MYNECRQIKFSNSQLTYLKPLQNMYTLSPEVFNTFARIHLLFQVTGSLLYFHESFHQSRLERHLSTRFHHSVQNLHKQ